ncbi:ribose 5-phosphate isomerase B [Bradyrhizobium guangdongense]|uniref:Ribose 5-phosphate isomerase B n=1 Tax=Bradyrhizobium guangdongense TaxID=1325090 RepID=A0A410VEV9_9BRAD|nr:ribose 5-phosphate isomerase B [Bradyrhizobium guangdongense]QAU42194.1 ribose 5-phosphate isomerase B [Bradyrhizobium guangdongense]QOZ63253.1 ribose 5-phosphate isomerase B [Bradyrhizobium guangdongense]GGI29860.1 ribose 5-phosphate isomerase B [Bradyrhizobium guangdongense]
MADKDESARVVAIACDHGGFALKEALKVALPDVTWLDLGTDSAASVDYPDFAHKLAETIKAGKAGRGILVCGSGIGISIAANRHAHIRCALVHDVTGARLCRQHNDANVLALGGRTTGDVVAKECVEAFLSTAFEGGRHQKRIDKLGPC